ncbi:MULTISPECIES: MetQ/NlpA family ABC transporter substrate-binding protein [Brevibacillus]|uniref:Lipoprotein n=2 Tax=Brevibacillus TaxID=55080 RepID=A0A1I3MER7_9BACL|nr:MULTISPECIES: MetQ/NlpA family ABC transporter substrate-binding protein [Brevibacillus]MEC2130083.1 MetQ/NlpA family ABC transporter substrate-binding protein [Brevibacillus centrosporus]MED1792193.1 MetQ/NlpA family ABC transporter substrate-binding protein [Brevibacillus nitrificans]MED4906724.1 MetQ/NlpA family ABC transporter substrate-binding protein [Brevibacillus centrosporus]RNB65262.1 MetQ/NlpA family ABC transporter substrate-binding protein [Brevibacillus centrosporus]RNB84799.1
MKKALGILASGLLVLALTACGGGAQSSTAINEKKIVVGVTSGLHEQILEKVKEVAAKDGLEVELKVFSDFQMPNIALAEKEIDANSYQTIPFLETYKKEKGADLTAVGQTVLNPMGMYSKKIKSLDELKAGDTIGLPNDPTNSLRALLLFQSAGLIKLKDGAGDEATVLDIAENPRELKFVELDAAQIAKQLDDVTAAAINTSYAIKNNLNPGKDAIFLEQKDSKHHNVIVVRTENKDDVAVQKLVKAYQTDEVKKFVEDTFEGSVIPVW